MAEREGSTTPAPFGYLPRGVEYTCVSPFLGEGVGGRAIPLSGAPPIGYRRWDEFFRSTNQKITWPRMSGAS